MGQTLIVLNLALASDGREIAALRDFDPMPDYDFGRCDGHHEMVDFRLRKKAAACAAIAFSYRHYVAANERRLMGLTPKARDHGLV